MAALRDASTLLAPLVSASCAAVELEECDAGAVRLAVIYAEQIDAAGAAPEVLEKLGPKLLTTLESLGATPAARARGRSGAAGPSGALGAWRASRAG